MAIRGRKTKKLERETARKRKYLSYYQTMRKAGKQAMTAYHYKRLPSAYFKGIKRTGAAYSPRKIRKMVGLAD